MIFLFTAIIGMPALFGDQTVYADHAVNKTGDQYQADQNHQVGGEKGEDEIKRIIQPVGIDQYLNPQNHEKQGENDERYLPEPP
jgi:hypothetical protein